MGNTQTKETSSTAVSHPIQNSDNGDIFTRILYENSAQSSSSRQVTRRSSRSKKKHNAYKQKRPGYEMIKDPNESVDGGLLYPQGLYQGDQDFKVSVVRDAIINRRMAPFYKGLDTIESSWTEEELLNNISYPKPVNSPKKGQPGPPTATQMIWLYLNVHECPICFLLYPRLNSTHCCGQDICTECFVQIKRNPPHPPYTSTVNTEATDVLELLSEPAACPFCAQPGLGIVFEAPPFEWGIRSSGTSEIALKSKSETHSDKLTFSALSSKHSNPKCDASTPKRNENSSVSETHSAVITVDMIRPDWEENLASARRRLARKSATARALHHSALILPRNQNLSASSIREEMHHYGDNLFARISQATHSMSASQIRALETQMIEEAIKASLSQ